jgi:hypothetical protein
MRKGIERSTWGEMGDNVTYTARRSATNPQCRTHDDVAFNAQRIAMQPNAECTTTQPNAHETISPRLTAKPSFGADCGPAEPAT